jgi:hypothetical protein
MRGRILARNLARVAALIRQGGRIKMVEVHSGWNMFETRSTVNNCFDHCNIRYDRL